MVALREASLAGYPVNPAVFSKALNYVNSVCDKNFRYSLARSSHTSTSLQALGIVSAWICVEQLTLAKNKKFPVPPFASVLVNRLEEFNEVFTLDRNDSTDPNRQYHYYYLWSVEQLGVLSGKKKFGEVNWYESGKRYLISNQAKDGSWDDPTLGKHGTALGTCFALLFMTHRTDPLRAGR